MQIRRNILLFMFTLGMISCSNPPSSTISVTRTPVPEQLATTVATESLPDTAPATTAEPPVVPNATPETPAGPDVNAIITKAMSMMASVGTFHFAMDRHLLSENEADELSVHIPVRGKFNAPDRIQGTVILSSQETTAILDFIIIGEELYLREQNSDTWMLLDWQSQAAQVVRENAFLPLEQFSMDNFHSPVLLGEARLGGLPVYQVRGELGMGVDGHANPSSDSIEFWIGKENYLIYRIVSERTTKNLDELAVHHRSKFQVDYANFGEPVLIVAPQVDTSGGYRPTGSYPTAGMLNNASGDSNPDLSAEQTESSAPATGEVASSEEAHSQGVDALD